MEERIKVPDLGGEGGEVVEINVAPGDLIAADDAVMTVESDKATMEIPSPVAGKIINVLLKVGDSAQTGLDMLVVETVASTSASEPTPDDVPETVSVVQEVEQVAAGTPTSTQTYEEYVPDIGGEKAPVVEIAVAIGDDVQAETTLVTLESDKATMEVPATHSGKVVAIHVRLDDELGEGDLLVTIEGEGTAPVADKPAEPAPAPAPAVTATQTQTASLASAAISEPAPAIVQGGQPETLAGAVYAGPAVRRLAREFGVDLTKVQGTGQKGRLLKEDVQNYVKTQLASPSAGASVGVGAGIPELPEVDFSQWGEVDIQPLNKLRLLAAQNFQRSWLNIPHVTQHDEADITELEAFRQAQKAQAMERGVRLTPLPFLLKAVAYSLQQMPNFCASLSADGQSRILKKYINIGIAVDTPEGLVVPVIKDVDRKGLWELAAECAELAQKARTKKLTAAEMKGGCFTISSLGSIGGTAFTPVVNSPEVAILGVSKASTKPHWDGNSFVPRLMLPLSLSYDHRAINGAEAAQFTVMLADLLGDIRGLLL